MKLGITALNKITTPKGVEQQINGELLTNNEQQIKIKYHDKPKNQY